MDRKTNIKIEVLKLGWTLRDLSDKTGICYFRLIKILNGYQPFSPEEEQLVQKILTDRQAEVINK